jgi:hypothetical protein
MHFTNGQVPIIKVARELDLRLDGAGKIHCWHGQPHNSTRFGLVSGQQRLPTDQAGLRDSGANKINALEARKVLRILPRLPNLERCPKNDGQAREFKRFSFLMEGMEGIRFSRK